MKYYFKCPSCGSDAEFSLPREESSGLGLALFLLGGWLPWLLYADARRHRVQCAKCGYIFRQPALPRTAVSRLAAWVIGIILVFGLFALVMIAAPEILNAIPQSAVLAEIEQLVAENPRAILFGLLSLIVAVLAIFVLSVLVSWVSNHRAHAELRKEFETRPKQRLEMKQGTAAID